MGGEWTTSELGDLTINFDGKRKPVKESERRPGPYPYYGASGVVDHVDGYLFDGDYLLIAEDGENLRTRQTPIAFIAGGKFWVNNHAHIVTGNEKADTRFLMYALQNADLNGYLTGAVMPKLTQGNLNRIEISHPRLPEQRAIAHILGTLDDKIELNRRRNQTLEAMARALFKDWFVDFGPVRAKMGLPSPRGRGAGGEGGLHSKPYLPADLWQLFPDRLDDEGKPEGWVQQRVGDIGAIICGKTPPTKNAEYYGDDVPFITIPEMHGNIFATDVKKRLSHHGAQSQQKKTLPPGSICVSCIATLGLVVITTEPSQTNQQINSVIPHQEDETYFWYWSLKNLGEEIKAGGSGGSVLGNLSTGRFSELRVNASSGPLRLAYNARVENLFSQILANELESQTLAQLRDTLLPKLISGELRIKDAKKFMESVA